MSKPRHPPRPYQMDTPPRVSVSNRYWRAPGTLLRYLGGNPSPVQPRVPEEGIPSPVEKYRSHEKELLTDEAIEENPSKRCHTAVPIPSTGVQRTSTPVAPHLLRKSLPPSLGRKYDSPRLRTGVEKSDLPIPHRLRLYRRAALPGTWPNPAVKVHVKRGLRMDSLAMLSRIRHARCTA